MLDLLTVRRLSFLLAIIAPGLLCLVGCHRGPAMAQVRGKVLYKDGSVPKGGVRTVRFEPTIDTTAEIRKGATGQIESDGSFQMSTRKVGDGVYLGKYAVTFAIWKGPRDPTSLVAEKYTNSATTPYTVTVDDDKVDLNFVLEPIGAASAASQ